jgi:hypothetical protein
VPASPSSRRHPTRRSGPMDRTWGQTAAGVTSPRPRPSVTDHSHMGRPEPAQSQRSDPTTRARAPRRQPDTLQLVRVADRMPERLLACCHREHREHRHRRGPLTGGADIHVRHRNPSGIFVDLPALAWRTNHAAGRATRYPCSPPVSCPQPVRCQATPRVLTRRRLRRRLACGRACVAAQWGAGQAWAERSPTRRS